MIEDRLDLDARVLKHRDHGALRLVRNVEREVRDAGDKSMGGGGQLRGGGGCFLHDDTLRRTALYVH